MQATINKQIIDLNERLIFSFDKTEHSLGLAEGKMGFCIYFYIIGRQSGNDEYLRIAGKLLDEICRDIRSIQTMDVKTGLAGIGLGIHYLITREYVSGNPNMVLLDIDNVIFKHLSYAKFYDSIDSVSLIHILYYLCIRLKDQKEKNDLECLYQDLIIQTINNLHEKIDDAFFEESLSYNVDYQLPQLLYLLSILYNLKFYNNRIVKIIEEYSYKVLSTIPRLHANRLYMLWGMNNLNEQLNDKHWDKHINLICNNIDVSCILTQELKNKNIFIEDGVVSIYYLISSLHKFFTEKELNLHKKTIQKKIEQSEIWSLMYNDQLYFTTHMGLYNGFCGMSLLINKAK